jgi:AmiR/NasT family two-component response regulator
VLFLTPQSDEDAVRATVLAGAAGYLLKEIGQQALIAGVETFAPGERSRTHLSNTFHKLQVTRRSHPGVLFSRLMDE